MAMNNIYPTVSNEAYKKYAKVPINMLAGLRVDPTDTRVNVGWLLSTDEDNYDLSSNSRKAFVYDDEVIEIYSELEDKMFRRLNKGLFAKGLLKDYHESQLPIDTKNFISDAEITEIVDLRSMTEFMSRLDKFDSLSTLNRIRDFAISENKSVKKVQAIDARIKAVQDVVD
jgi:hypothetical protein